MFYKVTMIEKNDNHREMIVRAESEEAAVAMIPAAKDFLFPGEDTSEYLAFPGKIHLDVMSAQVPHWRITVIRPTEPRDEWEECGPGTVEMTLEAENAEDAIRQMKEEFKSPAEFYAREVPMAEMIAEEKGHLVRMIREDYLNAKHGELTVRKYNRLMRQKFGSTEEQERHDYEALHHFLGKLQLRRVLERNVDLAKITVAEHEALITALQGVSDNEKFMEILNAAKEKYRRTVED